ncbi:hypothetical protein MNBD_ACTINO02-307 [hydrothermal vent metagenome]|uniref:Uncharacterized protein n=1 Tax=hydrothermal vent metagenome TaxID=652676 RepID=A0A3B0SZY4_9ZZZZ
MNSREAGLARVAGSQRGVFTRAQALGVGFSARALESRVETGMYDRLYPGVFAIGGSPSSWRRDVAAAVLSRSALAAASHKTAAHLWGMTSMRPNTIEVVTRRHRRTKRDSFTVRESKDLRSRQIEKIDGVDVTSAARTVVDLGASAPVGYVETCVDAGLRKGLFVPADVKLFLDQVARKGRTGVGTIRPIIEARLDWTARTESVLEDRFRALVASSYVPLPIAQFVLREPDGTFVCRADFAYPERRALIELDGEAYHVDRESFQTDRLKQNRAHSLGWVVYRFTWHQIVNEPDETLNILASITAR